MLRFVLLSMAMVSLPASAGQNAAPSSHFVFDDDFEGDIIVNEVRVPADGEAMYTYYETLGWRGKAGGYAGIQAHPKAHNYIFSIWDHKEHTAPIKAVHTGPGTLIEKFGGEGTGLKSWNFELGWNVDVWYTLVSRAWAVGDHTFYGFWVRSDKTKRWTHMVTMDVAVKDAFFNGGTDAFLEDWLETGKNARTTNLRGAWKRKMDGAWHAAGGGRYSVNAWDLVEGKRSFNYKTNWNGGVAKDGTGEFYFMTAGGAGTEPTVENPSKHAIARDEERPGYAPIKIKSGALRPGKGRGAKVTWEVDAETLPPFSYEVRLFDTGGDALVATAPVIDPHVRETVVLLPEKLNPADISVWVVCVDILGNTSDPLVLRVGE